MHKGKSEREREREREKRYIHIIIFIERERERESETNLHRSRRDNCKAIVDAINERIRARTSDPEADEVWECSFNAHVTERG